MKRFFYIFHSLGILTLFWAVMLVIPYIFSLIYEDGWDKNFLYAIGITAGIGAFFYLIGFPFHRELRIKDGLLLVFMVWLLFPAVGTIPFMLPYHPGDFSLSFTHAYYEVMSGLTTTGSTVIADVSSLPKSINAWRHALIWVGGMGILVLAVAILPLLGIGGHQVMRSEATGPMKEEKLTPRIAGTAKILYMLYLSSTLFCVLCYRWAGLSWFDAWCHAGSTMGLGGFSTYTNGYADINNPRVELVACIFMLIAGINFATHFTALRTRSLKAYLQCPEAIPFLTVVLSSAFLISMYLFLSGYYTNIESAFRYGFFNTISLATTTGYANIDYALWPIVLPIWMLILGNFSSSAGSTGGGVKMIRMVILCKQIGIELKSLVHPRGVFPLKIKKRIIDRSVVGSILLFLILYTLIFMLFSILLLISGLDYETALSATLASISNIGPALGEAGPMGNYGVLNDFSIWVCTFAMLVGRLELFTVLIIFTPVFWRK
ncbi:TrkH family potassium uptake protein [Pelistega sp. NLN82]|uniref:Trk system potassium uptake protein n=1 Tax=Pelistega ratti TaxID=2652177 RepID=A0A6L9Y3A8_9BURK|nr:potassium transporter TrkG [Pelistega ratti]NEN74869.1 TrkH family potassium uptake protein [Pelistega ratti]